MSTGTLVRTAAIKVKRMLKKLVDLHDQGVDLRDKKIGPAHQEELMKHFGREGKRPEIDSGKLVCLLLKLYLKKCHDY